MGMPPRVRVQSSSAIARDKTLVSGKADEWPREVKSGSVIVKIYKIIRRDTPLYCITHYLDNHRHRQNFADPAEAQTEAKRIASKIANAEREVLNVNHADWRLYALAKGALKPTNVLIDQACREYAEAKKNFGTHSLLEAAKYFLAHQSEHLVTKTVPELAEEFIAAKKNACVGTRGLADYRSRLRRVAQAFKCPVAVVTKDQLQEFLDSLKIATRTKRNFKTSLVTFFDYARSRNCLPRDRKTEAEHLDKIEVDPNGIEIFKPESLAKLLHAADDALIPYLAIRAFVGVRDSEVNRLKWSNVRWD